MNDFNPEQVLCNLIQCRKRIKYFPYVHIEESYICKLCEAASAIFLKEKSVLELDANITVCGDTHGEFIDTLRIFDVVGLPPEKRFLFLGDYVDRGSQSIENIVLLLTLKVLYPNNIFMLRGNHETEEISTVYGLRYECIKRYGYKLYPIFIKLFETMPFAAVVKNSIFCVHGGICNESCSVKDLSETKRPLDINNSPNVTDILWSDPSDEVKGFVPSPRGVSYLFGKKEVDKFLKKNNLSMIIRSHEYCPDGYAFPFGKNGNIITVFSASNYCGTMNSSAIVSINENLLLHFILFEANENLESNENSPK